eukprot:SAG31_NODE_95_length_25901_cov_24.763700_6_plen_64_part_00
MRWSDLPPDRTCAPGHAIAFQFFLARIGQSSRVAKGQLTSARTFHPDADSMEAMAAAICAGVS